MASDNALEDDASGADGTEEDGFDAVIFAATLTAHRSLGRRGFVVLMGVIAAIWFGTGLVFWRIGAWPVFGFCGLDVLAIYLAFRINYRQARAYEEIEVSRAALVIRKVAANGRVREFRFNPLWVRLRIVEDKEEGVTAIRVLARGEGVPVGGFLNPDDRTSFAGAFGAALAEARR
ncbi:Uncharacterized membrane protein [Faunimonas pinastri]|uniref:Uncharacterized membrane protein n=1 Tax=Faunimonas pinastri TaxID=1855383 RepID=A0A1H9PPY5_9HYPH|nr:DUF2244 domain-containing protein [Faunimonas pinastri]SER50386.1 Uncharacterized membrane protein [Faunimonas pinastri]